ncbi:hypothetical protein KUTeg_016456 [Tegillarca granosa]|uniref:N-acetyltransferase domain-containing protein n=1 Tax=Tegillarca granosa TaxID=220873 RepID=A0ABQ9ENF1_TEGGR|nr:hypothetical protein KUTeg_016456 [Tegillarca granosa]
MDEKQNKCYCGPCEISAETPTVTCNKCQNQFHLECLKSGPPSTLIGDVFFNFTCVNCSADHEEDIERMKMQWTQVVLLALYNLQLSGGVGKFGYYRWKEHICAFIDKHWTSLFSSHRKKTSLWHGTVAGTLSSGCPHHFVSGAQELGETGWWRLTEMKPPFVKTLNPAVARGGRRKVVHTPIVDPAGKVDGLRSRRGKTSIEAAMELKAKRETLLEAKEIRRAKTASPAATCTSILFPGKQEPSPDMPNSFIPLDTSAQGISFLNIAKTQGGATQPLIIKQEFIDPSFQLSQNSNFLMNPSTMSSSGSSSVMEPSIASSVKSEIDEDSQFSHSSSKTDLWLTEKDLKPNSALPPLFMCDDNDAESDSDLEIDPGTITPPDTSPAHNEQSLPEVQDILSALDNSKTELKDDIFLQSSNSEPGTNIPVPSKTQLNIQSSGAVEVPVKEKDLKEGEEESVVDSESNSSSSESDGESVMDTSDVSSTIEKRQKRKRKIVNEEENKDEKLQPEERVYPMSLYEERQLLRKLNTASEGHQLPPEINRLRRKLIIRQIKRERGLPIFDVDAEMNRLARKCWGNEWESEDVKEMNPHGIPTTRSLSRDVRILDRYQTTVYSARALMQQQPSFLNRLVGTEDDQLQSICSPYTARMLKPFIRRDYESRPLKMKLLEEIKQYPHRNDKTWKPPDPPPIDYCYVRPQHIPSVNMLCQEFFWPGIDLSECLQYPDFSCVVLFRKIVIGFAFMVPDVKYNEAYISFIFTHPEWRRAGIAKFMLYHLIQVKIEINFYHSN